MKEKRTIVKRMVLAAMGVAMALIVGRTSITAYAADVNVSTWSELQTAFDNGDNVTLTANITAGSGNTYLSVPKSINVILNLNGKTINRNLSTATEDGCVIRVNGYLTINDTGGGTITGGNNGNNSTSWLQGGGIFVDEGATLTLNGGKITGNKSKLAGAGVYLYGTFYHYGGSIEDNTAANSNAGGVWLNYTSRSTAEMYIKGSASIKNNHDSSGISNVNNFSHKPLYVQGSLSGEIGIKTSEEKDIAQGNGYTITQTDANCFKCDRDGYSLKLDNNTLKAIVNKNLQENTTTVTSSLIYDATDLSSRVKVYNYSAQLVKDTDYTIKFIQNGDVVPLKNAGTYSVEVTGIGAFSGTVTKTIKVEQKTVQPVIEAKSKVYDGTTNAELNISFASGQIGAGDTVTVLSATGKFADSSVGNSKTVTITGITLGGASASNYKLQTTTATSTADINKKEATITADSKNKQYKQADSPLTAKVTGTIGSETLNYTLTRATGENIGTYNISVTPGSNPNYNVTTNPGTFTITKASVEVKANAVTKKYGEDDPKLTFTVTPAYAKDDLMVKLSREEGERVDTYDINVKVEDNANYVITKVNGTFTITKDASVVKEMPTAKAGLVANGTAQSLINSGTASNGTMLYAVATGSSAPAASAYSETIPTGTDAGTYNVYYMVKGDANHNDTAAAGPVSVTIASGSTQDDSKTDGSKIETPTTQSADKKVTKVKFTKKTVNTYVGKTLTLKVTVTPSDAANKVVTWKSSNTKVATVDKNGKITAKKKGTATITVTTKDGKMTAKCKVTVK